jgi:hypothetical protein
MIIYPSMHAGILHILCICVSDAHDNQTWKVKRYEDAQDEDAQDECNGV